MARLEVEYNMQNPLLSGPFYCWKEYANGLRDRSDGRRQPTLARPASHGMIRVNDKIVSGWSIIVIRFLFHVLLCNSRIAFPSIFDCCDQTRLHNMMAFLLGRAVIFLVPTAGGTVYHSKFQSVTGFVASLLQGLGKSMLVSQVLDVPFLSSVSTSSAFFFFSNVLCPIQW